MYGVTLGVVAIGAAALAWLVATLRARAETQGPLREAEGRARGAAATVDELRRQIAEQERALDALRDEVISARAAEARALARLEETARAAEGERALLDDARAKLGDTFKALAADALRAGTEEIRRRAVEGVVTPVKEALGRLDEGIRDIEKQRAQAYGALTTEVRGLSEAQERLRTETGALSRALRTPATRGRWGEVQLRRVVEMAGMLEHCDFEQQVSVVGEDGRLRPDMVVRLPGGQSIVVDAKVPLGAYLEALETDDEAVRAGKLREHAAQVRAHMTRLAAKGYWEQFDHTPEMVVMFIPGEAFYGAALEQMPSLLEEGVAARVLVATPPSLITLLRAAHVGWREQRLADGARAVSEQGKVLHERLVTFAEHLVRLGQSLGKATRDFDVAAASFEGRLLPAARKLEELGARGGKDLPEVRQLDLRPRLLARDGGDEASAVSETG